MKDIHNPDKESPLSEEEQEELDNLLDEAAEEMSMFHTGFLCTCEDCCSGASISH